MRTTTLVALPVAAGLAFGGASLATAEDSKPAKRRPAVRVLHAPPSPFVVKGGFLPGEIGIDQSLGEQLAKELGMTQEKVDAALRKVLETRLNAHRDRVLACFDDPARCGGIERPALALPRALMNP